MSGCGVSGCGGVSSRFRRVSSCSEKFRRFLGATEELFAALRGNLSIVQVYCLLLMIGTKCYVHKLHTFCRTGGREGERVLEHVLVKLRREDPRFD